MRTAFQFGRSRCSGLAAASKAGLPFERDPRTDLQRDMPQGIWKELWLRSVDMCTAEAAARILAREGEGLEEEEAEAEAAVRGEGGYDARAE